MNRFAVVAPLLLQLLDVAGAARRQHRRSDTTATTTWYNNDQNEVGKDYDELVASLPSLAGKCVAITGTTSGTGYWSAVAAVKKGVSCLIMLNRPSERAVNATWYVDYYKVPGVSVYSVDCDLMDLASVRRAAVEVDSIASRFGGLDVLMNNAGVMNQPDLRSVDGFDVMMQTNLLGHFVLTKSLMPLLKRTAANAREVRVVMMTSLARTELVLLEGGGPPESKYFMKSAPGGLGGDGSSGRRNRYHQSKQAELLVAMALHQKLAAAGYTGVKALAAAPGFARTHLDMPPLTDFAKNLLGDAISQSGSDGACPLLVAAFAPSAKSGDFYEPDGLTQGPAAKIIDQGNIVFPLSFLSWAAGIRDEKLIAQANIDDVWAWSEEGLGERFDV